MNIFESIRIALSALRANTVRTLLAMLGIIIGVAAVIAMMAVGSGATARIEDEINSIGSNLLIIFPGSITSGGLRLGAGAAISLTEDDVSAIMSDCPAVAAAAPSTRGTAQVVYGDNNWATMITGTTPAYLQIRDYTIALGRPFTNDDVTGMTKVALLGQTVVRNLFDDTDPIDHIIRIKNVPFRVIGVLSAKGQSPSGQDQDDVIIMPITTAKTRVLGSSHANARSVGVILAQARSPVMMDEAIREIRALLRQRHHLQPGEQDDFTVRNLSDIFAAEEGTARTMSILLGAIASISLLVGGIGIMNIMLATVMERTREIGTRIAIGARKRDILTQFLVEALTLSLSGGIVGVLLGMLVSALVAYVAGWSTLLSWDAIALAFLFSGFVGVFFGYWPARKAAFLNPIDALRYE